MEKQFSAGIVVYRINAQQEREYLLLHYPHGHWDFSKGHLEENESELQAALRELKEETGLSAELIPGFKEHINYWLQQEGIKIYKTVTFFVGIARTTEITLSYEHRGYAWLPYEQAISTLTYDNAKKILKDAHDFLMKNG